LARRTKGSEADRELIQELTDELVDAKGTRDGIPGELFPLRSEDLEYYKFALKGDADVRGRKSWDIVFEPADRKDLCIHLGEADGEGPCHQWKGEAWIDAEDYQPARINTQMAKGVPWGVRVFLGTNVRQLGFSINYQRVAGNVWFPATYGTEFSHRRVVGLQAHHYHVFGKHRFQEGGRRFDDSLRSAAAVV
jgi:hypothetical protein